MERNILVGDFYMNGKHHMFPLYSAFRSFVENVKALEATLTEFPEDQRRYVSPRSPFFTHSHTFSLSLCVCVCVFVCQPCPSISLSMLTLVFYFLI